MHFPNGVKYTGNFVKNNIEGKGKLEYNVYECYEGDLQDYKRNGSGEYTDHEKGITYKGDWKDDQFDGKGELTVKDRWVYKGEFVGGVKEGEGVVEYLRSKNYYKGRFENNKKNGFGEMQWIAQNQCFEGDWKDDKMEGFGYYIYLSALGSKKNIRNFYVGNFSKNKREGFGLHFYSDGSCYIGEWVNSVKDGKALYIDDLGYFHIKNFTNNHLKDTRQFFLKSDCDNTIPKVAFIRFENKTTWNEKDLENILKTYYTTIRAYYDSVIENKETSQKIAKMMRIEDIFRFFRKIRIFNLNMNTLNFIQIIRNNKINYTSFQFDKLDLESIKKKVNHLLDGKIKSFNLHTLCDEEILFSFNNFLNLIILFSQYKFKDSDNIEMSIREFLKNRVIKVISKEIVIKDWIKDEKSIIAIYKKFYNSNQNDFEELHTKLLRSKRVRRLRTKELLEILIHYKIYETENKAHMMLFLRIIERHLDPFDTIYNEMKTKNGQFDLLHCPKFLSLLNISYSKKDFINELMLLIHIKEKKIKVYDVIQRVKKRLQDILLYREEIVIKTRNKRDFKAERAVTKVEIEPTEESFHEEEQEEEQQKLLEEKENFERELNAMIAEDINILLYYKNIEKADSYESLNDSLDFEYIKESEDK